ncbi:Cns1p [Saccharomyces cerevisiae YJM326]|uniref:Cns1p n=1 Tax=Saccharomyces cerevisiae (strain JAY291) TaxID=574961 RepID=C7GUU9_YEAS2|nr:Cns1p [Saccharomyces cerevisiae YJM693]AJP95134.1 Cns1p [Saccharomyces cerevisiae YJM1083]AJP96677.1 Cns1p [Saccharomyces cerevisiae YJM1199]AJP98992.1 Cns1p [Saccharomyces cerevisiae YJM1250]AJQ02081.1 Cns1p [Saccharomyces cerevisiae YJM320]AJQ02469.1 Cns1p [Saccharomyces cerevisiae YJM326]AJQ05116.1 Cns1p [Saccharomyces cerevisiae YJM541]AJQ05502.1 Cns1p [Saccharomyces cerevisiae YJM554]AJQ07025.1 Cns1p [Saccharomyces cerevisiae YJM682]AJQ07407.1 Cns1p [Saccharomyces cerevisiae YJM683
MSSVNANGGYTKPQKYVPGPGDPELPPQLSEFKDKTSDEILKEMNRMPFFMTKLDETDGAGGENVELEALKALAYEGEPHEIAENFKKQGNELYKAKRFKDARELYSKGLAVEREDKSINESLYANRAACELELKNYRRCIEDCSKALTINPKNVKCYYRTSKAFFQLNKLEEAKSAATFANQRIDQENKSILNMLSVIDRKEQELKAKEEKQQREAQERENKKIMLESAMTLRNITNIKTHSPVELLNEGKIRLEDPMDFESQLIYPALIMYPTQDEFDFVGEVSELTTVQELVDLVLEGPQERFKKEGKENFTPKKVLVFMETKAGGLIKAGKKLTFHDILKKESPDVPLFDNALKIYIVPKVESEGWISKWDKQKALESRSV